MKFDNTKTTTPDEFLQFFKDFPSKDDPELDLSEWDPNKLKLSGKDWDIAKKSLKEARPTITTYIPPKANMTENTQPIFESIFGDSNLFLKDAAEEKIDLASVLKKIDAMQVPAKTKAESHFEKLVNKQKKLLDELLTKQKTTSSSVKNLIGNFLLLMAYALRYQKAKNSEKHAELRGRTVTILEFMLDQLLQCYQKCAMAPKAEQPQLLLDVCRIIETILVDHEETFKKYRKPPFKSAIENCFITLNGLKDVVDRSSLSRHNLDPKIILALDNLKDPNNRTRQSSAPEAPSAPAPTEEQKLDLSTPEGRKAQYALMLANSSPFMLGHRQSLMTTIQEFKKEQLKDAQQRVLAPLREPAAGVGQQQNDGGAELAQVTRKVLNVKK